MSTECPRCDALMRVTRSYVVEVHKGLVHYYEYVCPECGSHVSVREVEDAPQG